MAQPGRTPQNQREVNTPFRMQGLPHGRLSRRARRQALLQVQFKNRMRSKIGTPSSHPDWRNDVVARDDRPNAKPKPRYRSGRRHPQQDREGTVGDGTAYWRSSTRTRTADDYRQDHTRPGKSPTTLSEGLQLLWCSSWPRECVMADGAHMRRLVQEVHGYALQDDGLVVCTSARLLAVHVRVRLSHNVAGAARCSDRYRLLSPKARGDRRCSPLGSPTSNESLRQVRRHKREHV